MRPRANQSRRAVEAWNIMAPKLNGYVMALPKMAKSAQSYARHIPRAFNRKSRKRFDRLTIHFQHTAVTLLLTRFPHVSNTPSGRRKLNHLVYSDNWRAALDEAENYVFAIAL